MAFEAVIFLGGDHPRALAPVTGDGHRLGQGQVLITADVPLKFTGGNLDGRIAPSTKKFTETFLDEVLAWINIDNGMATLMRQSMTGDETYRELKKFEKRRKSGIRKLSRLYKNRRDVQS
jgi:hypothetical protein